MNNITSNKNENTQFSLNNFDNYKSLVNSSTKNIIEKYSSLIFDYLKFIIETIQIKNKSQSKYILIRGIETITHVFQVILFYTRNLDVTYFNSQKAFYFYVEFISQISEIEHSFLQLSSKDAVMYVYKKTIFEINNENKKNISSLSENDKKKFDILKIYNDIYKQILILFINNDDEDMLNSFIQNSEKTCKILEKLLINNDSIEINIIQKLQSFIDETNINIINKSEKIIINNYFENIENFIKKIKL